MALRDRIFAALYDRVLAPMEEAGLRAWRADLLSGLSGTVVEVGAGTGANLAHYPPAVARLVVTEPEPAMLAQLRQRLGTVHPDVPVEVQRAASASLPLADGEADAVVSTLVLCSVTDQAATLAELRRVLRPGGRLVFLEHVAADHKPRRLRWQHRFDHVWPFLCGGCHLTRRTAEAIEGAGFVLEDVRRESARKASPLVRTMVRGSARVPA